jgi:Lar family restriction alleviation protein
VTDALKQAREALKPCPFCGHTTPYFERMGTPRQSCIVACGNCGCRHESSDEGENSGRSWNERAQAAQQREPLTDEARDAARWRWVVRNCEWRRRDDDRDGRYSMLCVRLPYEADQSCVATRTAAIDAAMKDGGANG